MHAAAKWCANHGCMNIQHPTKTNSTAWLRRTLLCAAVAVSVAFTGCETPAQSALLGAAIGGGAGYIVGKDAQNSRRHSYRQGYYRDSNYGYRDSSYDNRRHYSPRPSWHRY